MQHHTSKRPEAVRYILRVKLVYHGDCNLAHFLKHWVTEDHDAGIGPDNVGTLLWVQHGGLCRCSFRQCCKECRVMCYSFGKGLCSVCDFLRSKFTNEADSLQPQGLGVRCRSTGTQQQTPQHYLIGWVHPHFLLGRS